MAKQTSAQNVIGRDKIIKQIWRTLEDNSIVFTAERRIGKTTVMNKMAAEPLPGRIVLYSDLEKVGSAMQFVEVILSSVSQHLTKTQTVTNWFQNLLPKLGGTEVSGVVKLPPIEARNWQSLLETTLDAVCKNQTEQQLIFLWDEIPYMLQKIHETELKAASAGQSIQNSALAILDTLRAMRNKYANLRMIFTGSVGLHHVLSSLRDNRLASQPVNDMFTVKIGPLSPDNAGTLALKSLKNDEIECDDETAVISSLVTLTDAVPFYIHRLVSQLALDEDTIKVETVEEQISEHLVASHDPWEMEHFRDRLKIYYPGDIIDADNNALAQADIAKRLLNHLAVSDLPQSIDDCFAFITSQVRIEQRDSVITLLASLAKDHYIHKDSKGRYQFLFPLLKRWWILAEGLNA